MRRRFLNNIKNVSNDYHSEYLTIKALENGLTAKLSTNACEYRIDNGSWNNLSANSNTPSINKGQILSFKGSLTPKSHSGIGTFTISKKCNLNGNIMSMLYSDDFVDKIDLTDKNYAFSGLFRGCTNVVEARNLMLPATTLASSCYSSMFSGCSSLTTAPELPATTLADACYHSMFSDCTSLNTAPELPATILVNACYHSMFYGTNVLPDCSNIDFTSKYVVTSGALKGLFDGTKVTDNDLMNILPKNNEGKYCLPVTTLGQNCYDRMFNNCTSLTTAPVLPATTLASGCYFGMFGNCKSLTTAPELPTTTLADACYYYMFSGCSSLTTAPVLPATLLTSNCYYGMFSFCTSLTTAPELPATYLADSCYSSMFNGCASLTTAPELPATYLADSCYSSMFSGCSSLTTAPVLPATLLTSNCYYGMFSSCSSLNNLVMLATDISASSCLSNWVKGVAKNGTFVKHTDMTSLPIGNDGIPSGWEVKGPITPTECNSLTITADDVIGNSTTTTIHYTAICNGIDYKGNTVNGFVEEGTAVSSEFPQNTSETETVERTITFEFLGVTASTVITQGVWVNQSYTVYLNNQWELSSTISNPDNGLYDGVYQSFSNKGTNSKAAVMYIDIYGYTNFDLYIRSYAESNYDYVMVSLLDQDITNTTSYSNTTLVKAHTRGKQNSGTALSNYTPVQFTGIDGEGHRITIVYRKDGSSHSYDDRGYLLIPKN